MARFVVALVAVALVVVCVSASDVINGLACKSPATVVPADFAFEGFREDAATNNSLGIGVIPGFAAVNYPALNTQGLSLAKFNYAKGGLVPPHTHPRASEVITVLKGEVYVGFVDTAGKLFAATLKTGDFFLFPRGLVHFQLNSGSGQSETVSVLNAQSPGIQLIATSLFGSSPFISEAILSKAFGVSAAVVDEIRKALVPGYDS
jgi:quercetin dioxygenase-like cupin family protein